MSVVDFVGDEAEGLMEVGKREGGLADLAECLVQGWLKHFRISIPQGPKRYTVLWNITYI